MNTGGAFPHLHPSSTPHVVVPPPAHLDPTMHLNGAQNMMNFGSYHPMYAMQQQMLQQQQQLMMQAAAFRPMHQTPPLHTQPPLNMHHPMMHNTMQMAGMSPNMMPAPMFPGSFPSMPPPVPMMGSQMPPAPDGFAYQFMPMLVPLQQPTVAAPNTVIPCSPLGAAMAKPTKAEVKDDDDSVIECTPIELEEKKTPKREFSIIHLLDTPKVIKQEPIDDDYLSNTNTTCTSFGSKGGSETINRKSVKVSPSTFEVPPSKECQKKGNEDRKEMRPEVQPVQQQPTVQNLQPIEKTGLVDPRRISRWDMVPPTVVEKENREERAEEEKKEVVEEVVGEKEKKKEREEEKIRPLEGSTQSRWRKVFEEEEEKEEEIEDKPIIVESSEGLVESSSNESLEVKRDKITVRKITVEKDTVAVGGGEAKMKPHEKSAVLRKKVTVGCGEKITVGEERESTVDKEEEIDALILSMHGEERKEKKEDERKLPPIPPRFPAAKRNEEEKPLKFDNFAEDKDEKRANPVTIILKKVPENVVPRIRRHFEDEKYGRCIVSKLKRGTVRVEFDSRRERDRAVQKRVVRISRHDFKVYEDFDHPIESESMKGKKEGLEKEKKDENEPIHLKTYHARCEKIKNGVFLTAGPIPSDSVSLTNKIVEYFKSYAKVMDVPFNTSKPREYLILKLKDIHIAKRVLSKNHRVEGQVIEVCPPFDVHLTLSDVQVEDDVIARMIQDKFGVLSSLPHVYVKSRAYGMAFLTFGRAQDAMAAINERIPMGAGTCKIGPSSTNQSFSPFVPEWEGKMLKIRKKVKEEKEKEERRKEEEERKEKERRRRIGKEEITDYDKPILTVGPIPEELLKECEDKLLNEFEDVHEIPYAMEDKRIFRIVGETDHEKVIKLLKEGSIDVGEKKILVSPPFDVDFETHGKNGVQVEQLIEYMQRKYGPIVRKPVSGYDTIITMTFGRIFDAMRAVEESPHFKSRKVVASEGTPNRSFRPFCRVVYSQELMERAKRAERTEQAPIIKVKCDGFVPTDQSHKLDSSFRRRRREEEDEEEESEEEEEEKRWMVPVKKRKVEIRLNPSRENLTSK